MHLQIQPVGQNPLPIELDSLDVNLAQKNISEQGMLLENQNYRSLLVQALTLSLTVPLLQHARKAAGI